MNALFDRAREEYIQNDYESSIKTLKSIPNIETSFLIDELRNSEGNKRYLKSILESPANELMGLFDCPYHPYLRLEYSRIADVFPSMKLDTVFSNIRCVNQYDSTVGLSNDQVVAIFPENFKSVRVEDKYPVFFFVGKFVSRHLKYTNPLIGTFKYSNLFYPLLTLSADRIEKLVVNWVNIHEVSHRKGMMPLPKYLTEKSNRYTAAIEELRADLLTIYYCFRNERDLGSEAYLTGVYALAERLLAYPLFRDRTNFDAISSVIFWKFLMQKGFLSKSLNYSYIKKGIEELIIFIASLEKQSLKENGADARKNKLRDLVTSFIGDIDFEFDNYYRYWRNL